MKGRLLLDVVVRESTTILELLASENKTLLVGWNAFFILNFCLHVVDVSEDSTSRVIVFPVRIFANICIPPRRQRTRCNVDSFWML